MSGIWEKSGERTVSRREALLAMGTGVFALGSIASPVFASEGEGGAPVVFADSLAYAVDSNAGGLDSLPGAWREIYREEHNRHGLTVVAGDDGGLVMTTSYYQVCLSSELTSRVQSYCYGEDMIARRSCAAASETDASDWDYLCHDLYLYLGGDPYDGNGMGVYLRKYGRLNDPGNHAGEPGPYGASVHQQCVAWDLGEAAIGSGWHVIAYVISDIWKSAQSEEEAIASVRNLASCVALRGSSSEPPLIPDDIEPVFGG